MIKKRSFSKKLLRKKRKGFKVSRQNKSASKFTVFPKNSIMSTNPGLKNNYSLNGPFGKDNNEPKPKSSIIYLSQINKIIVLWNTPMTMICDIKDQINVIIDGAAPVHPISVIFDPSNPYQMEIVMATPFLIGHIVTWTYDNTGICNLQQTLPPNTEADNKSHLVANQLKTSAFSDDFSSAFH